MKKFIEVTQRVEHLDGSHYDRKSMVNVDHIKFYYNQRIVFEHGAIDVRESREEITNLIFSSHEEI